MSLSKFNHVPGRPLKYKTPSEKQQKAWSRNWYICTLRAYYHLCPYHMPPSTRAKIQELIDGELARLGAELESIRIKRRGKELQERCNAKSTAE